MTENFNSQYNPNEEESTISIVDIWHMIWDYKWWYVLCAFVCVCVAALYLYRTPDTYQRTAKVIIGNGIVRTKARHHGCDVSDTLHC